MRPLTQSEKRTIRLGAIAVAVYLTLFLGLQARKAGERRHTEYTRLRQEAVTLRERLSVYHDKAAVARDLMETFRFDPAQLSRTTLVAQATAAIHQAAVGGGLQLGPIRESPSRSAARELTSIQLEGMGPVPAVLRFLQTLGSLGFPLVAESLQITPQPGGPGQLKINLTLVLLDFDRWTPAETRPDA